MSYSGEAACHFLASIPDRVELIKKDNSDKFWAYRIRAGRQAEIAFDPRSVNTRQPGLMVRLDARPPALPGLSQAECLDGQSISTALRRVFSSGREARYKVAVHDESALQSLISHLERE